MFFAYKININGLLLQLNYLVGWSYIVICEKCGYISTEKLPEDKAKKLLHEHEESSEICTTGHIKLMKVRT